jgi:PAS domain S-box-containing protein
MHTRLELYQKVSPLTKLGIWERNLLTGEVYWNATMRKIYDLPADYNPVFEKTLPFYDDPAAISALIEKTIQSGEAQTDNFLIHTPLSTDKWVKVQINAHYSGQQCVTTFGTLEDVTAQVNMLKMLEENEQRFEGAFEHAPIGMAIVGLDGSWIKVNKSLMALLGYEEAEFLKHTFQDFTHPDDLNYDLSLLNQLVAGEISTYNIEKRYFHRSGTIVWANLSVSMVRDQQNKPLYFISQILNVTERQKHAEILLRERQRLDNIIKSTRVGTWEWNIVSDEISCNQRAANILGYERTELATGSMNEWKRVIHPRDYSLFIAQLERCLNKEKKYFAAECRMLHKEGRWLWVEIRGKVIKWSANDPLFVLGTYADVHERKILEQEREQTMKLIKKQNDRLMNFAHIVSHNLRSHTGNIQMLLEVLRDEEDQDERDKMFEMLVINSNNLQETLSHLNDVVKINTTGTAHIKSLFIIKEVNKVLSSLSQSIQKSGAAVDVHIEPDLSINYNPAYFESILLNLISNAIKYRNPERPLVIGIKATILYDKCVLEVQDNGLGMDLQRHGDKIFGMYKTFHGNEDARGVGLFIVKSQIDAMGSNIEVKSRPGFGTTFTIEIF